MRAWEPEWGQRLRPAHSPLPGVPAAQSVVRRPRSSPQRPQGPVVSGPAGELGPVDRLGPGSCGAPDPQAEGAQDLKRPRTPPPPQPPHGGGRLRGARSPEASAPGGYGLCGSGSQLPPARYHVSDLHCKTYVMYLPLALLGLRSCVGFYSRYGEWGLLSLWCVGFSLQRLLLLWSAGLLQADSSNTLPLSHQGRPRT